MAVEPLLHAGDALIVDIDVADNVRDFGAAWIVALVLIKEADARQALAVNLALLLRSDVALEPDEAALGRQPFAEFRGIDIGQVGGEQFDGFIDVDQPARLAIERRHAHIGRQHFAIAVEDIGTRRGDRIAADAVRGAAVGDDTEQHEPHRDDEVDDRKRDDRQARPAPAPWLLRSTLLPYSIPRTRRRHRGSAGASAARSIGCSTGGSAGGIASVCVVSLIGQAARIYSPVTAPRWCRRHSSQGLHFARASGRRGSRGRPMLPVTATGSSRFSMMPPIGSELLGA